MINASMPSMPTPLTIPIDSEEQSLKDAIGVIRTYLGMDVAFIAEFCEGNRVFRYVDATDPDSPIQVGKADPLEQTYCQRIVDGRLPQLIHDSAKVPGAAELAVTQEHKIRAHISVPIVLQNGEVYGTFCCLSHVADWSLNKRDLDVMRAFADLTAKRIDREISSRRQNDEIFSRIHSVLDSDELTILYQPIYDINEYKVTGFEALSRFNLNPPQPPEQWFSDAVKVGQGVDLEIRAIKKGLEALDQLPEDMYISVNASPDTILSEQFNALFKDLPLARVLVEITEHVSIAEYSVLGELIRPLREQGLQIAVDDAGAGFASFRHILSLAPDVIKLDTSIIRNIHKDKLRRALTSALIAFAREIDCKLIAEGVESESELEVLLELGVKNAQGFLLARPMPLKRASALA